MIGEIYQEQRKSQRQLSVEKHWRENFGFDNDDFKRQTGVDVYNVENYHARIALLIFWQKSIPEDRWRILNFAKKHKEAGISAFMSFSEDKIRGNKILEIGEFSGQENSEAVFSKLSEISHFIEDILSSRGASLVSAENFSQPQIRQGLSMQGRFVALDSTKMLAQRIYEVIDRYHDLIVSQQEGAILDNATRDFIDDLEKSKTEITILSALLKTAKEQGVKLTPENIRDMKMETREVGELSGEEKAKFREKYEKPVMEMMRKSYAKIFAENPDAQAKVESNFRERFENLEKYRVYVLMFQGEAAAFSVIDPNVKGLEEGEVMSESTVVHPDVQKGAMGIEFLKMIFEREFQKYGARGIRGKVRSGHPAGESYDRIGLVVDKSRPIWVESGVEYESRVARKEPNGSGQETLNRQ